MEPYLRDGCPRFPETPVAFSRTAPAFSPSTAFEGALSHWQCTLRPTRPGEVLDFRYVMLPTRKKPRARRANNLKGGADRSSHEYAYLKWTPNMMAAYVPYLRQPMCSPHLYSCHPLLYSNNKPVACEMHGSTFIHNALVYCYLAHLYHGRIISGGSFCSQHRGL